MPLDRHRMYPVNALRLIREDEERAREQYEALRADALLDLDAI